MDMMENKAKKKYSKPSAEVVEWDFSEAICDTVLKNSFGNCIDVRTDGSAVLGIENRTETGDWEWTRTGSR